MSDPLELAHRLLSTRVSSDRRTHWEDPDRPETIQAMQIALNIPKVNPPLRHDLLEASARAVVSVCLDERIATDELWRAGLVGWYDHLIRKVARRARNKAWDDVQELPGVTVSVRGAQARAFVPSAVNNVPAPIKKLQIRGTELSQDSPGSVDAAAPVILIDADLHMSIGKAAAQVGHASMLFAAKQPLDWVRKWAKTGFALSVREVSGSVFSRHALNSEAVIVRDAGFTEVAPDSLTVFAIPGRLFLN